MLASGIDHLRLADEWVARQHFDQRAILARARQCGDPMHLRTIRKSGVAHIVWPDRLAIGDGRRDGGRRNVIGIDLDEQRLAGSSQDQHVARGPQQRFEQHGSIVQFLDRVCVAHKSSKVFGAPDQLLVGVRGDGGACDEEEVGTEQARRREGDQSAKQGHPQRERSGKPALDHSELPAASPGASPNA